MKIKCVVVRGVTCEDRSGKKKGEREIIMRGGEGRHV